MSLPVSTAITVDMHPIDAQLRERLQMLQSAEQTDEVKRSIAKLEFAIEAVIDSCHPTMAIAVVPR